MHSRRYNSHMESRIHARLFEGPAGPWLRLMRFDRPVGILLLLWPAWWGLWAAAGGIPSARNLVIFTAGVIVMRAAGCVVNDLADRDFDPRVERTRDRPIAAGEIKPGQALALFAGLMILAFGLVLMTNRLTILLAFGGALLAATYPFFKRFTHLPQLVLGIAFGWAVPMAFAAEAGDLAAPAWWLFAITVVWALIYDTEYAMTDRADDARIGVKSTALLFGRMDVPVIAGLMGLMTAMLVMFGLQHLFHPAWFAAVAIAFALFQVQLWWIREREPAACFRAFLNNRWVGLALFLGMAAAFAL